MLFLYHSFDNILNENCLPRSETQDLLSRDRYLYTTNLLRKQYIPLYPFKQSLTNLQYPKQDINCVSPSRTRSLSGPCPSCPFASVPDQGIIMIAIVWSDCKQQCLRRLQMIVKMYGALRNWPLFLWLLFHWNWIRIRLEKAFFEIANALSYTPSCLTVE